MEDKIGHKLKTLTCMIAQSLRNNDLSLNGGQCFIISFLDKNGGVLKQSSLEEMLKVRRSSITSVIQNLEKNGYIIRKEVVNDKRQKEIILTEKGKAQSELIKNNISKNEEKLTSGLSNDELDTLRNLLDKLIDNMKEKSE